MSSNAQLRMFAGMKLSNNAPLLSIVSKNNSAQLKPKLFLKQLTSMSVWIRSQMSVMRSLKLLLLLLPLIPPLLLHLQLLPLLQLLLPQLFSQLLALYQPLLPLVLLLFSQQVCCQDLSHKSSVEREKLMLMLKLIPNCSSTDTSVHLLLILLVLQLPLLVLQFLPPQLLGPLSADKLSTRNVSRFPELFSVQLLFPDVSLYPSAELFPTALLSLSPGVSLTLSATLFPSAPPSLCAMT